ncbi:MAG: hypothetical protein D6702_10090 [Planctomycetota bacterium]|nr:MAG: hypothetical protein D6702_10090 [Planctomycetota bacterium]
MFGSLFRPLPVGRLFGIPLLVMPAVLLLTVLVLAAAVGTGRLGELALLLLFLAASLLAHEFGHALVARRLGLRVLDVTIWPLGGLARMEGIFERPEAEAPAALAGPAVNLVLAGLCALLPGAAARDAALINLVLGLGNLAPAFPLDGGRVLRSWFARRSPLADATAAAVRIGSWTGTTLLLIATLNGAFWLGLLLLLYVWFTGKLELVQVILRTSRTPRLRTGEVLLRSFRGQAPGEEVHPAAGAAGDPRIEELESFRGGLDEFFHGRRR